MLSWVVGLGGGGSLDERLGGGVSGVPPNGHVELIADPGLMMYPYPADRASATTETLNLLGSWFARPDMICREC